MEDLKKIPFFFIIGRPRSGTTMLRMLFEAHPNIIVPPESPLILRLHNKYKKVSYWTKPVLEHFYEDLVRIRKFDYFDFDREVLRANILNLDENITFTEIIKYIYINYNSVFEKDDVKLLGDKNPVYSTSIKRIAGIFPDAKIIYITRDYRDHILSMLRVSLLIPNVVFIAYRWKLSVKHFLKLQSKQPLRFYKIRYEDFVVNPEKYLKEMCSFLGVDYSEKMIKYSDMEKEVKSKYNEEKFNLFFSNLFKPISSENIGKWKNEMDETVVRTADLCVGKFAKVLGYDRKYKTANFKLKLVIFFQTIKIKFLYSKKLIFRKTPKPLKRLIGLEDRKFSVIESKFRKYEEVGVNQSR